MIKVKATLCLVLGLFSCLLMSVSCGKKVQTCSGKVRKINDSAMVVRVGEHSVRIDTRDAEYSNGFVLVGDSVSIRYVGDFKDKDARALTVRIIPRSTVVDAVYDPSKELKTADRPLGEKASEDLEKLRRGNH